VRAAVDAGDYAIHAPDGRLLAALERKSLDNLASTLSDGTLAFQLQRLAELPLAAIVVEARYRALFKLEHVNGNWLADQLTRLQVRYPGIPIVFADTRRHAEDWTHRFLTTALTDAAAPS
jgi:ERCC4-type nuclease